MSDVTVEKLDKRPTNPIFWIFFILAEIFWIVFIYFYYRSSVVGSAKFAYGDIWLSLKYEEYSFEALSALGGIFAIYIGAGFFIKAFKKSLGHVILLLILRFFMLLMLFSLPISYSW